jgi:hypothetical protein
MPLQSAATLQRESLSGCNAVTLAFRLIRMVRDANQLVMPGLDPGIRFPAPAELQDDEPDKWVHDTF